MMRAGHNSLAPDQLRTIVERVEHLEGEKAAISDDIKQVYSEAKGNGFDAKAAQAMLDLYADALGLDLI